MNQHENSATNAAAFLAGAAIGALAGLLLAPRSGRQTRGQLGDLTEDWADGAAQAVEKVRRAAEAACGKGRAAAENGRDLAEHEIEAAKAAWRAGRDAWRDSHPAR